MASVKKHRAPARPVQPFDLGVFLRAGKLSGREIKYDRAAVVFSQGDPADDVIYIKDGNIRLSVLSRQGKEAVVALLGAGEFVGEGCLAGQPRRMATATTLTSSSLISVEKQQMLDMLHTQPELADRFISHMLVRNIRIEEDLVDQLFNSSEKRLARALLLLAQYGNEDPPHRVLPKVSQETLAEMIGSTRSRVNYFMNKFRDLGFIEYNGRLKVNPSLMGVVLHD